MEPPLGQERPLRLIRGDTDRRLRKIRSEFSLS